MTAEPSGLQAPAGPLRFSETDIVSGLVDPTPSEAPNVDPDVLIYPRTRPEHVTLGHDLPLPRTTKQQHNANERSILPLNHERTLRDLLSPWRTRR